METMLLDDIELRETAKRLYDSYSTVLSESKLISIIQDVLGDFAPALDSKYAARRTINDLVMGYYPNEATIKANFIDRVLFPLSPANISIFELPIGNSRVDMCKVNGHSAAYEIKTDLDTFDRLEGQLSDYFDVFETVYVVTSDKRWQELPSYVPEACGIYSYSQDARDGSYHFKAQRKAIKSTNLDSEKQLAVMPKRALCETFGIDGGGMSKPAIVQECLSENSQAKINRLFKAYLKQRYGAYWEHFCKVKPRILGIDYEWFYRNRLEPGIVY